MSDAETWPPPYARRASTRSSGRSRSPTQRRDRADVARPAARRRRCEGATRLGLGRHRRSLAGLLLLRPVVRRDLQPVVSAPRAVASPRWTTYNGVLRAQHVLVTGDRVPARSDGAAQHRVRAVATGDTPVPRHHGRRCDHVSPPRPGGCCVVRMRRPSMRRTTSCATVSDGSLRATFVQVLALGVAFIGPAWGLSTLWLLAVIDRIPFLRRTVS